MQASVRQTFILSLVLLCTRSIRPEPLFVADHAYVLVRKEPSIHAPVVAVVPRATELDCVKTGAEAALLGTRGHWFRCAQLGFVYGPLLSNKAQTGSGLRLKIWHVDYHEAGESIYELVAGRAKMRGWTQHTGPPYPPRKEHSGDGTYSFKSGQLEIRLGGRTPLKLTWLPVPGAYVPEHHLPTIRQILAGQKIRSAQNEYEYRFQKDVCSYSIWEDGRFEAEQRLNLFCIL